MSIKLTIRKSSDDWDWYVIERAEHDGRTWFEPTGPRSMSLRCSSRISDADIEGTAEDMLEIAKAIRDRGQFSARRCAVVVSGNEVEFWSPRNSRQPGVTDLAAADELAGLIEQRLAPAAQPASIHDGDTEPHPTDNPKEKP